MTQRQHSPAVEDKIMQMVGAGKTIVQICNELGLDWQEVSNYVHSVDARSWRGAKQVISRRLKRLVTENDLAKRKQLSDEADRWVAYLYESGKHLGGRVDRARKALND